jgi:hypothetical protein
MSVKLKDKELSIPAFNGDRAVFRLWKEKVIGVLLASKMADILEYDVEETKTLLSVEKGSMKKKSLADALSGVAKVKKEFSSSSSKSSPGDEKVDEAEERRIVFRGKCERLYGLLCSALVAPVDKVLNTIHNMQLANPTQFIKGNGCVLWKLLCEDCESSGLFSMVAAFTTLIGGLVLDVKKPFSTLQSAIDELESQLVQAGQIVPDGLKAVAVVNAMKNVEPLASVYESLLSKSDLKYEDVCVRVRTALEAKLAVGRMDGVSHEKNRVESAHFVSRERRREKKADTKKGDWLEKMMKEKKCFRCGGQHLAKGCKEDPRCHQCGSADHLMEDCTGGVDRVHYIRENRHDAFEQDESGYDSNVSN